MAVEGDDILIHSTNCPNCGAPIRGLVCEYCGTVFDRSSEVTLHSDEATTKTFYEFGISYAQTINAMRAYAGLDLL